MTIIMGRDGWRSANYLPVVGRASERERLKEEEQETKKVEGLFSTSARSFVREEQKGSLSSS